MMMGLSDWTRCGSFLTMSGSCRTPGSRWRRRSRSGWGSRVWLSGSCCCARGGRVAAPSTLGTFLRAFTFGHVRQLDRVLGEALTRAWRAGAGPGVGRLVVDVDSFIGEVHGYQKQGASFGYTKKRGYHPILASRAETGEVLHVRLRKGAANTQRGILRFTDELIARIARAGATGA